MNRALRANRVWEKLGWHHSARIRTQYARAMMDQGNLQAELVQVTRSRDQYAAEIVQIRAALSEVSVYEGLVDVSPVAMMVSELVRDHEELEARIDAVMLYLRPILSPGSDWSMHTIEDFREIARLLQGGNRVPDTPEGLS